MVEHVPVSIVDEEYIDAVEEHQKQKFVSIGVYDTKRLLEFATLCNDLSTGHIELKYMISNNLKCGGTAGILIADDGTGEYFALAGVAHGSFEE